MTPEQFLALLTPYIELHKNPKVRGRAGGAAAAAVARMQVRLPGSLGPCAGQPELRGWVGLRQD